MSQPGDLLSATMVARVVPDVTGLDKQFDYLVPEGLRARVAPGCMVRVPLHGRRVGSWVISVGPTSADLPVDKLMPIAKWSGVGPSPEIIELARWAAIRWGVNRLRPFLVTASPPTMVGSVPGGGAGRRVTAGSQLDSQLGSALDSPVDWGVRRISPNTDPLPIVLDAVAAGPTLVIHPAHAAARAIAARLRRQGLTVALVPDEWARAAAGVDVVVGSRAAVWAPCPGMAAVVVLDEHDEALQEERSPTWHARDVAIERARRAGASCVLVSPAPTVTALHWAGDRFQRPPLGTEREGWPLVEIIDRSDEEPWKRSLVTSPLIRQLRDNSRRVVCVLNTVGRARLLACRSCRSLQRCERCDAAVAQNDTGTLVCGRCDLQRPPVCQQCGSGALALVKRGVTRVREELEAAAGRPVVAVTATTVDIPEADVYVGTEAVLHRLRSADVVAFLDLDAELLAPRYRAAEQALVLLVRAARLVGPRSGGGRLLVQTHLPNHEVLQSARFADPSRLARPESARRELLGLPPFRALAVVEGAGTDEFAVATGLEAAYTSTGVLLRAESWDDLGRALAATPRPRGSRLRIEVDPPRR